MSQLVLKRRLEEKTILIIPPSDKPRVVVVWPYSAQPSWAKIAFEAPPEVSIQRIEVLESIAKFGNMHGDSPTQAEAAAIVAGLK